MKTKHFAALGFCLIAVVVLAQNVPIYKNQGGTKLTIGSGAELEMQSGSTLDIQSGVTVGFSATTFTEDVTHDDGTGASPSSIYKDGTDETATFTKVDSGNLTMTIAAADSLQVLTGSFAIGNGVPDVALDGEDAYIEGTLEVDGAARFDGVVTLTSTLIRTGQEYQVGPGARIGASAGWLIPAGNLQNYTLPAGETSTATLVIPISGQKIGWEITGFKVVCQIESAGNTVELDAELRKTTTVAAGNSDASVGAIVGINVTADTAIATVKTGLSEVVTADTTYYILLSGTTAASTDIDFQHCTITYTTN